MLFDKLRQIEERSHEIARALVGPRHLRTARRVRPPPQGARRHQRDRRALPASTATSCDASARPATSSREGGDRELHELAQAEIDELAGRQTALEEELKRLLRAARPQRRQERLRRDPRRAPAATRPRCSRPTSTRMYTKYAERQRWKVEVMDASPTGVGGLKDVILFIQGRGAWSRLKFERGVHRVQRVPVTESAGRIHTSTVTVAVLPEAEDVDVKVEEKDLRVDVYRSSGPGRPGRQHDRLGGADHPPADRPRRDLPGRALADQEPGEGDARPQGAPARARAGGAAGGDRGRPAQPGRHRRAQRADPHLQLPADPRDRSPDRAHAASAARPCSKATSTS